MAATSDTEKIATGATGRIARVYAEALAAAAKDKGEDIGAELAELSKSVFGNAAVAGFIKSPVVGWRAKEPVLMKGVAGQTSEVVRNFIGVLNKNGRLGLLPQINAAYQSLRDTASGRVRVTVKSAVALGQDQQNAIAAKLATQLKQQPVLNLVVDPELLGGLVIQIGDKVQDSSVRTRLQSLRAQLNERGTTYVLQNQG